MFWLISHWIVWPGSAAEAWDVVARRIARMLLPWMTDWPAINQTRVVRRTTSTLLAIKFTAKSDFGKWPFDSKVLLIHASQWTWAIGYSFGERGGCGGGGTERKKSLFITRTNCKRRKMMNYIYLLNSKQNGDYSRLGSTWETPVSGYQSVDCPMPISTPKLAKMSNW